MSSRWLTLACCMAAWMLAAVACPAQDFIRGDSNEDGVVTLADSHRTLRFLFFNAGGSLCHDAADFDNDDQVDITDAILNLDYQVMDGGPPPSPFPDPGPDTGPQEPGSEPCTDYGGEEPIDDPAASIRVLDTVVSAGELEATILLAISSSGRIGGYFAEIDAGGIIAPTSLSHETSSAGLYDLSGTLNAGFAAAATDPETGRLRIGFLSTFIGEVWIPPGDTEIVLEVHVCLDTDTPPGVYPMELTAAEFAEYESGRRIDPELVGGTLSIVDPLPAETCFIERSDPGSKSKLDITFELGQTSGPPGGLVDVPFLVSTTDQAVTRGLSFSIDFDETALELVGITTILPRPDGRPWTSEEYQARNLDAVPGKGPDEGNAVGRYIYSGREFSVDESVVFPTDGEFTALSLEFQIKPEASSGSAEVAFRDGGDFCFVFSPDESHCYPWRNEIISGQVELSPDLVNSFVFVNGLVNIVPDVTIFRRGDSNGDRLVDISDAQATLGYLFLGNLRPGCLDAADANDDGALDISDPIQTLLHLFSGHGPLPPPSDEPGEDPTPDGITCAGIE